VQTLQTWGTGYVCRAVWQKYKGKIDTGRIFFFFLPNYTPIPYPRSAVSAHNVTSIEKNSIFPLMSPVFPQKSPTHISRVPDLWCLYRCDYCWVSIEKSSIFPLMSPIFPQKSPTHISRVPDLWCLYMCDYCRVSYRKELYRKELYVPIHELCISAKEPPTYRSRAPSL